MALNPQILAADLADTVLGPKQATGEMSQAELDANGRNEWPLHYAIADALGGTVKPFDQYQGPYVLIGSEIRGQGVYAPATPMKGTVRIWIYSEDGEMGIVYNEENDRKSSPFFLYGPQAAEEAVAAAQEVVDGGNPEEAAETHAETAVEPGPGNARMSSKKSSLLHKDDHASTNSKLQAIVGDPLDQPVSAFAQFKPNPGTMQMPNPMSPIEGDEMFFMYLISGAVFQSHDGQQWEIEDINQGAYGVLIFNRWYPRQRAQVNIDDVRRSIHSWVEPVQVVVPPPPPGVSYIGQPVRIIDGKSHV